MRFRAMLAALSTILLIGTATRVLANDGDVFRARAVNTRTGETCGGGAGWTA
jgi:hypothetical protein